MSIADQVNREIVELHQFFEAWLAGNSPNSDDGFRRFEDVLAVDFTIVTPDGTELDRDTLVNSLRQAHGARPSLKIWVEGIQLLRHESPILMARYEECQVSLESSTRRISTVLFQKSAASPNGLTWLRVHETWKLQPED